MLKTFSALIFIFTLLLSRVTFAGGPLVLEGPTGNTAVNYFNPNITVHIENGTLGVLTNTQADALVQEAFDLWNTVPTATINLAIDETQLAFDINLSNYEDYLPNTSNTVFNGDDNLNPVVYDSNGEIIDAFFGVGASESTIGFAASIFTTGNSHFEEGYAVINGKFLGLTDIQFKLLIAHEIGHFFGLDHTQTNINPAETYPGTPSLCSTDVGENYAVMYPFVCRNVVSLHSDDISSVSALYPPTDINNSFGILQGHFANESGIAILGANIWVENTVTGDTYSIASDYLRQGTGFYKLYLPAGTYTLHANSINPEFYAGSGIGPYTSTTADRSFTTPHPLIPVTFKNADTGNQEVLTIDVNTTIDIDFSSTGTLVVLAPPGSALTSDSSSSATSWLMLSLLFGVLMLARLELLTKLKRRF